LVDDSCVVKKAALCAISHLSGSSSPDIKQTSSQFPDLGDLLLEQLFDTPLRSFSRGTYWTKKCRRCIIVNVRRQDNQTNRHDDLPERATGEYEAVR